MRSSLRRAGLLLVLCPPTPALAEGVRDRLWHGTLYVGQMLSHGTLGLRTDDSSLASAMVSRVLVPELRTELPSLRTLLAGSSLEVEAQLGQHLGLQRHQEATLALLWRTREIPLGALRVNLAVAEGFSYALSRPTHEGVANDREPRKFLNYLAFEAEISHPAIPGASLVPRLHHRSGIFGVIAPGGSGSDFIGLGLRMTLR